MRATRRSMKRRAPFISMRGVTLRLYDKLLFRRTDWRILSDQQWAVLGPTGSGKSTLVRALWGDVPVVRGEIVYHFAEDPSGSGYADGAVTEEAIAHVTFEEQKAAIGQERPYLQARWNSLEDDEALSVVDFLSWERVNRINPFEVVEAKPRPARFRHQRDRILEWLEMEYLAQRRVMDLSNGETRKLLIAEALLRSPQLLILDDPFSGLDHHARATLRNVLAKLMRSGMRIILVTTRAEEVFGRLTHVLCVDAGRVVGQGPREKMLRREPKASSARAFKKPLGNVGRQAGGSARQPVLIRMRKVNVTYDRTRVLSGVDWTVRRGQHWALLGPNGSGKTTLISLIVGDNPQAYANDVQVFGRQRGTGESVWEVKHDIGWISPELHLHYPEEVTAYETVCSGFFDSIGLYEPCDRQQRRLVRVWMERLGLRSIGDRFLAELSYGEQRLVLLARALVKDPTLLILDEPCQGLDPEHSRRVRLALERAARASAAQIIYVTHRYREIPDPITHVLKLRGGKVVRRGTRRWVLGEETGVSAAEEQKRKGATTC